MSKSSVVWTEKQYAEYCRNRPGSEPLPDKVTVAVRGFSHERSRKKTQAESEYEIILRLAHPNSKILYEAIKLRIADRCHYCPDFTVVSESGHLSFIEVKGPHIWEDSKIKFKAAREMYPWAKFEMHQKRVDGWKQIY